LLAATDYFLAICCCRQIFFSLLIFATLPFILRRHFAVFADAALFSLHYFDSLSPLRRMFEAAAFTPLMSLFSPPPMPLFSPFHARHALPPAMTPLPPLIAFISLIFSLLSYAAIAFAFRCRLLRQACCADCLIFRSPFTCALRALPLDALLFQRAIPAI